MIKTMAEKRKEGIIPTSFQNTPSHTNTTVEHTHSDTQIYQEENRPLVCVRVRLQPVGLTASGSNPESLSGPANVNLSSSCDRVN